MVDLSQLYVVGDWWLFPQSSVRDDAAAHLIGSLNYNAEAPPIVSCIQNTRIRDYDPEDQAESRSKYCDIQQFLMDRKS